MRDPHVTALHYMIIHNPTVDYSNAVPKDFEIDCCKVHVQGERVTFTLKEHFATDKEARDALKPFINAWEVFVGLDRGPGQWELRYEKADIIDRNPDPQKQSIYPSGIASGEAFGTGNLTTQNEYPPPPSVEFSVSGDVLAAYDRYKRYKDDRELLASMAYFVLTVIEAQHKEKQAPYKGIGKTRQKAGKHYAIDPEVLGKLGDLSSAGGGLAEARKHYPDARRYKDEEKRWIEKAVAALIRRAGERAAKPTDTLPQITMNDLPPLP